MLISYLIPLVSLLPLIHANPDPQRGNMRYGGGGGGYGDGRNDWDWDDDDDGPSRTNGYQAPAGTQIYTAGGRVAVPRLSASVPLASATATVNANGKFVSGQARLKAVGGGPGICAQKNTARSTFVDGPSGRTYNLICGRDAPNQGENKFRHTGTSWDRCLALCASTAKCDTVVYSRALWICWLKNMRDFDFVRLGNNSDRAFAYLPSASTSSWLFYTQTEADFLLKNYVPATTTTTTIAASGVVTIPSVTSVGTITSAAATISNGTTVAVNILIRWPG